MSHIIKSLGSITWSDIIEIAGIIASTITSIIAIAISVKTLRQNNKMLEESTRPNIQIYSIYSDTIVYIMIKNFGQSSCTIDSISCDHKFSGKEIFNDDLGEDIFARFLYFTKYWNIRIRLSLFVVSECICRYSY